MSIVFICNIEIYYIDYRIDVKSHRLSTSYVLRLVTEPM